MRRAAALAVLVGLGFLAGGCGKKGSKPAVPQTTSKPDPGLAEALDLFEAGKAAEAAQKLEGIRQGGEASPEAYSLLVLAYLKLGQPDTAEAVASEAKSKHPGDDAVAKASGRVVVARAQALLAKDDRAGAKAMLAKALAAPGARALVGDEVSAMYRGAALARTRLAEFPAVLELLADHRTLGLASPEADLLQAFALARTGRRPEAEPLLAKLAGARFEDPAYGALLLELTGGATPSVPAPVRFAQAEQALAEGRAREALRLFQAGIQETRGEGEAGYQALSGAMRAAGELKETDLALSLAQRRAQLRPDDVEAQLDLGRWLAATGSPGGARELYERLLTARPDEARVKLALASLMAQGDDIEGAEEILMGLANDPGLPTAMLTEIYDLLGILSARRKDFEGAESWWTRVIGQDPEDAKAYYNLGILFLQKSRFREAVDRFEKAVEYSSTRDPAFSKYLYWLALGYHQNGQHREMERILKRVLAVAPAHDPYRKKAEELCRKTGSCDEPMPFDPPADPDHALYPVYRSLEVGDYAGMEGLLKPYVARLAGAPAGDKVARRDLAHGYWLLATAARRQDLPARAVVWLEAAVAADPADGVRQELARALFDLGLFRRSLKLWEQVAPGKQAAARMFAIARCRDRLGLTDEAMEAYEESISLDPAGVDAAPARERLDQLAGQLGAVETGEARPESLAAAGTAKLAAVYLEDGDLPRAKKAFDEALALDPQSREAWLGVGAMRLASGDARGATEAYSKAHELDPGDPATCLELGRLVARDPDRNREAFELFSRAREAGGDAGLRATGELVRLYRAAGQLEDARVLVRELEGDERTPASLLAELRRLVTDGI